MAAHVRADTRAHVAREATDVAEHGLAHGADEVLDVLIAVLEIVAELVVPLEVRFLGRFLLGGLLVDGVLRGTVRWHGDFFQLRLVLRVVLIPEILFVECNHSYRLS